jgi:hypothetical protein
VNVLGTDRTTPLTVVGHGPNTTVTVGNPTNGMQSILGAVNIQNAAGQTKLNVDDSADSTPGMGYLVTEALVNRAVAGTGVLVNYSNISSLVLNAGSGASDDIAIPRTPATMAVTINAGGGGDTVHTGSSIAGDLSLIQGPLTVNGQGGNTSLTLFDQSTTTPQTYSVTSTGVTRAGGFAVTYTNIGSLTVNGGSSTNTLQGPDSATIWQITGTNAGSFTDGLSFTAMQNLLGGADADTFVFADSAGVSGSIDGGGGVNTFDYSAYLSNVLVNLQTSTATGIDGGIANIQNVIGGNSGPAGSYNILVGNGGNILTGGNGRRNLLIAGSSASQLIGGNDDDIVIGGTTAYDTEANMASLQAIMAYWTGADDYLTRVNNLTTGNGVPLLDATTVKSNGGGNTLLGGDGLDLFFGSIGLDNHDKLDGEVFLEV